MIVILVIAYHGEAIDVHFCNGRVFRRRKDLERGNETIKEEEEVEKEELRQSSLRGSQSAEPSETTAQWVSGVNPESHR